ncbi:reverse transcriptase domain-containing protein [Tanacetum coccineum]
MSPHPMQLLGNFVIRTTISCCQSSLKRCTKKMQQEKLKAVKARLNFEETSQYSKSRAPSRRRDVEKRLGPKDPKRETVFRRLEKGVFHRLGDKEKGMSAYSDSLRRQSHHSSRGDTESYYQSFRSRGTEPAPKRYHDRKAYSRKRGRMSESEDRDRSVHASHPLFRSTKENPYAYVKTYDGSEDPKDHLKIFQAAAKVERWAMPAWCHMFNSTLTGNARQKKCIKDPVEIHHIKQREGESTEDFVWRFKTESRDVKGASEVMRISGFMHGIANPELIKCLHDKIPKSVDEMWKITMAFLRGEVARANQKKKEIIFRHGSTRCLDTGKFKLSSSNDTPMEKRNASKFCEFHGEVGHTTDECMHLKRQIEEMLKTGKLSHLIKELKQNNGKDQAKVAKKGEAAGKDKPLAILMVQTGRKIAKQRITQTFSPETMISFPPLGEEDGTEGPMVIEAEIGGHLVHRMYVDGGASSEILYEHCFNQLRPKIRKQMVPAATYLVGFSGEIIWPLGQVSLLVKIGDEEHSTSAWMNFMVVRSHSPYNGIIGRPGVRRIKAIPSTAHGMLKFPVTGGTVTLRSSRIIPLECAMISGPRTQQPVVDQDAEEKIQVAIHPEYPEQTIAIGSTLTKEGRKKLCGLLRQNLDIFA